MVKYGKIKNVPDARRSAKKMILVLRFLFQKRLETRQIKKTMFGGFLKHVHIPPYIVFLMRGDFCALVNLWNTVARKEQQL